MVEPLAPRVSNPLALDDAGIPIIDRQGSETDLLGEIASRFAFNECRAGTVGRAVVAHLVGVATPMRLFLNDQKIAVLQKICSRQSADAATNNHHVVAFGGRDRRELHAVAHLMANSVVLAINL